MKGDVQWLCNVKESKSITLGKGGWKAVEGECHRKGGGRTSIAGQALPPGDTAEIRQLLDSSQVAYLLIDDERYADAPANPLAAFVEQEPGKVRQVWSRTSGKSSIRIYEVVPLKSPEAHQRAAPSNLRSP